MFKGLFDFKTQRFHLRWSIIAPVLFFILLGLLSLSSTSDLSNVTLSSTFYKQCIWFLLGVIAFIISQFIRIQFLYDCSYIFYFFLSY